MAAAKKCDICGRLYEKYYSTGDRSEVDKHNAILFVNSEWVRAYAYKPTDCCPECMKAINDFVYSLKKQGEINRKREKEKEE